METIRVACAHDCPDMCSLLVDVEDGRVKRIKGDPDQPFTAGFACAKVNRDHELVHSPLRLKTPLRRIGAKGEGKFAPVTWDEALDEIAGRWQAIIAESGAEALLGYAYSAHQGIMNRGLPLGLFRSLGATRLIAGAVCDTCCEEAWNVTVGPAPGADPETVDESDLVISWGADLVATNVHFWARVEAAKKRGVKLIVIDPRRSRTAVQADWHLPIRIGTDAALALGIMHILARDGLVDRDYVTANTIGFDRLEADVLPRFTPQHVAEITSLQAIDIEKLAAMYGAAKRSFIRLGEGMTRLMRGGEALRAVSLLPGVTGAYGRRGGGSLLLTVPLYEFNFDAVRNPSGAPETRTVNHLRLGDALLNMQDPPIRALFVAANNPAVTCPDAGKVRQGLMRDDLFTVVHDPFMTDTARYADIVLPATTYLETEDLYRAYGAYYLQYAPAAVPPQGEARSNFRVAQDLAQRMELAPSIYSASPSETLAALLDGAKGAVAGLDPERVKQAGPLRLAAADGQRFATPSGKLEFYSAQLAAAGHAPMPDWRPDPDEERDAARWPLRLLTSPGYFQAHTAYAGVDFLRRREGAPIAILHPDEAAARGLENGAKVRLRNDRGAVGLVLKISDEVRPGVVLVPGQRSSGETVSGTVNMLVSDRYTDLGDGATYQSTFLEVEAWRDSP